MNKRNKYLEIAIHALVWMVLYFLPFALSIGSEVDVKDLAVHFWLQLSMIGVIFYINYGYLIDNFLFKPKFTLLFFAINIFLLAAMIALKGEIFSLLISPEIEPMKRKGPPRQLAWYMDFLVYLIPVAVSIAIKIGKRGFKVEALKTEAVNMRLQAELQHLKFQFQPHFVFNALNNVYALIEVDSVKAQQSLHSLSRLMRHLMQTSEATVITLEEEIDFLLKYIEVMQFRLSSQVKVEIDFPKEVPLVCVTPLLFITLVENAFKHGVSAGSPSDIRFELRILDDSRIVFSSINTFFPKQEGDLSYSGIGLVNLRKRLEILYPNHFRLESQIVTDRYMIKLEVPTIKHKAHE